MDLKNWIQAAAERMGFDLCRIAPAVLPGRDRKQYLWWIEQGFHGDMAYMERPQRQDIQSLLPDARSVICVAMVYNTPHPKSTACTDPNRGWISRYAWGEDYHFTLRDRLERLLDELRTAAGVPFEARIFVDTAPVLERAFAAAAGLGWMGKNTCLIGQKVGSWFVVGELLTTLELEADQPAPDRCGTCHRCIDACPTDAILEPYVLDATRCISYFTIEARGSIPEEYRAAMGRHVFGCDICQDVCPWNNKAPVTLLPEFQPRKFNAIEQVSDVTDQQSGAVTNAFNPPLDWLASLSEAKFTKLFRRSPVKRSRYRGMLRNVAIAMGNSGEERYREVLQRLAQLPEPVVQEHARWALERLDEARSKVSTGIDGREV